MTVHRDRKALLDQILDEHIECRILNHPWQWHDVEEDRHTATEVVICPRCTSERLQDYRKTGPQRGLITDTRYRYVKGYLIEGIGHLTREDRGYLRLRLAAHRKRLRA